MPGSQRAIVVSWQICVRRQAASCLDIDVSLRLAQIRATLELLAGGTTIPFIARYRKEQTGSLDETQLRQVADHRNFPISQLQPAC